jgi:hypothetical protein
MLLTLPPVGSAADGPAEAGEGPRVVAVRTGQHKGYDRLVLELSSAGDVVWRASPTEGALTLVVGARARNPLEIVGSKSTRMGQVELQGVDEGTRVSSRAKPRRIRVFTLASPPRVVVDFADPGSAPFDPPPGTAAIEQEVAEAPEEPPAPEATAPEATVPEATVPEATVPEATVPEVAVPEATVPEATVPEVAKVEPPAPTPPAPPTGLVQPPEPPEATAPALPVERPAPSPAPPTPAERPSPPPTPPAGTEPAAEPVAVDRGLWPWLLAAGLVLGVALLGWMRWRSRELDDADAALAAASGVDAITPADLAGSIERIDALENRLDDEVRARMTLEERVTKLSEEHKVLRDRIRRAANRGEV